MHNQEKQTLSLSFKLFWTVN